MLYLDAHSIYIYIFYLPRLFDVCVIFWIANTFHPVKIFHFKYLIDPARRKKITNRETLRSCQFNRSIDTQIAKHSGKIVFDLCVDFPPVLAMAARFFLLLSLSYDSMSERVSECERRWIISKLALFYINDFDPHTHTHTHWNRTT